MSKPDFSNWHVHTVPALLLRENETHLVHVFDGRGAWNGAVICASKEEARNEARRLRRTLKS